MAEKVKIYFGLSAKLHFMKLFHPPKFFDRPIAFKEQIPDTVLSLSCSHIKT